jgi:hypothetical protein
MTSRSNVRVREKSEDFVKENGNEKLVNASQDLIRKEL